MDGNEKQMKKKIIYGRKTYVQYYRGHPVDLYNIENPLPNATFWSWVSPYLGGGYIKNSETDIITGCSKVKLKIVITNDDASTALRIMDTNGNLLAPVVNVNGWEAKTVNETIDVQADGFKFQLESKSSYAMPEGRVTIDITPVIN